MKNITIYEKEVSPIAEQVASLEINSPEQMKTATSLLSVLNKQITKITTEKEKITKPLNEALKAERARWKPIEETLEHGVAHIRKLMSEYQTALAEQNAKKAETIAKKVSEGRLKIETGLKKLEAMEQVETETSTTEGSVRFRTTQVLNITDQKEIPLTYYDLNESRLLQALKNGTKVPGAEIKEIQTPVNYRN